MNYPDIEKVSKKTWASKHKTAYRHLVHWSIIFFVFLAGLILLWPEKTQGEVRLDTKTPIVAIEAKSSQPEAIKGVLTPKNSYKMNAAAFSDVECGSEWCNKHEPKDGQVALNLRKWPGVTKVYVTAFDKTYRVVGNTYDENGNHRDIEFWFGNDRQSALEFGTKTLLVNIIE